MPLLEQSLDIEVEFGGAISIRPRQVSPSLSLKPYIELDIDSATTLQRDLQSRFELILQGDVEFSPFSTVWEPILDVAASKLDGEATHVTRHDLDDGETLEPASDKLRIVSSWAIFGRPRSNEARVQDIQKLRDAVKNETSEVPPPIRGYTEKAEEEKSAEVSPFGLDSDVLKGAAQNNWEPSASGDMGSRMTSYNISRSRVRSATIFFRRVFSSSSAINRRNSSGSKPPYLFSQSK